MNVNKNVYMSMMTMHKLRNSISIICKNKSNRSNNKSRKFLIQIQRSIVEELITALRCRQVITYQLHNCYNKRQTEQKMIMAQLLLPGTLTQLIHITILKRRYKEISSWYLHLTRCYRTSSKCSSNKIYMSVTLASMATI